MRRGANIANACTRVWSAYTRVNSFVPESLGAFNVEDDTLYFSIPEDAGAADLLSFANMSIAELRISLSRSKKLTTTAEARDAKAEARYAKRIKQEPQCVDHPGGSKDGVAADAPVSVARD